MFYKYQMREFENGGPPIGSVSSFAESAFPDFGYRFINQIQWKQTSLFLMEQMPEKPKKCQGISSLK